MTWPGGRDDSRHIGAKLSGLRGHSDRRTGALAPQANGFTLLLSLSAKLASTIWPDMQGLPSHHFDEAALLARAGYARPARANWRIWHFGEQVERPVFL